MEAPWFGGLSDATRCAFFSCVLSDIAMGLPEQQQSIIASPTFLALDPVTPVPTAAATGDRCILHHEDRGSISGYLEAAVGLNRATGLPKCCNGR